MKFIKKIILGSLIALSCVSLSNAMGIAAEMRAEAAAAKNVALFEAIDQEDLHRVKELIQLHVAITQEHLAKAIALNNRYTEIHLKSGIVYGEFFASPTDVAAAEKIKNHYENTRDIVTALQLAQQAQ